jgi:hypothetical protein
VLRAIIDDYTREAGVRNLEREIGRVFRDAALRLAENNVRDCKIELDELPAILGPKRFEAEVAMRTDIPGVATGLAWTPVGGDILFVEAARSPGSGKLTLTGQLGDVMRESALAALSLVKSRADLLGISADTLAHSDIHVHVPAGATPKDGPSAGVAMFVALASLLTNRPVDADVAMTGEISLRGLVLPIGGVKEKVLAAQRAGIKTVMLPARNKRDLEDVPPTRASSSSSYGWRRSTTRCGRRWCRCLRPRRRLPSSFECPNENGRSRGRFRGRGDPPLAVHAQLGHRLAVELAGLRQALLGLEVAQRAFRRRSADAVDRQAVALAVQRNLRLADGVAVVRRLHRARVRVDLAVRVRAFVAHVRADARADQRAHRAADHRTGNRAGAGADRRRLLLAGHRLRVRGRRRLRVRVRGVVSDHRARRAQRQRNRAGDHRMLESVLHGSSEIVE